MSWNFKGHLNIAHFKEKVHCRASFCKTFLMKDDVKMKVPNGTPKTLIPSNGVVNQDGVLKSGGKLESDHATHF
jgi:hypothetical protein